MNGVFISFVAVLFTVLSISTEATPVAAGGELNNNGKKNLILHKCCYLMMSEYFSRLDTMAQIIWSTRCLVKVLLGIQ